jgi:CRP/FNR family transcriptional regulator
MAAPLGPFESPWREAANRRRVGLCAGLSQGIYAALPRDARDWHDVIGGFIASTSSAAITPEEFTMHATAPVLSAPVQGLPAAGRAPRERLLRHDIAETLGLLRDVLQPQRRTIHAGDVIYRAGEPCSRLYILNSGFFKLVGITADGREQVLGLKFRGDWLGFDGIAGGRHACDAVAMDTGEIWAFSYDALLAACATTPDLMRAMHEAMSRELGKDRESIMSVCTLPADARVAEFLRSWAESLAGRGLRTDQFTLRMSRAEIGNYLGMTLETVSRALSRLARTGLIQFAQKGRRDISIPAVEGLAAFVQSCLSPQPQLVH